jgi:hypothetical protein
LNIDKRGNEEYVRRIGMTTMRRVFIATPLAFLLMVACSDSEEDVPADPATTAPAVGETQIERSPEAREAEADTQVIRWLDVTVEVPDDRPLDHQDYIIVAFGDYWGIEAIPALVIGPSDDIGFSVSVDAQTGIILSDSVRPKDREAVDGILKTLKVARVDPSTAPWPYEGSSPPEGRKNVAEMSYPEPDPASGFVVRTYLGNRADGGCATAISATNGRSTVGIEACSGEVQLETSRILPEDIQAFALLLAEMKVAGSPVEVPRALIGP